MKGITLYIYSCIYIYIHRCIYILHWYIYIYIYIYIYTHILQDQAFAMFSWKQNLSWAHTGIFVDKIIICCDNLFNLIARICNVHMTTNSCGYPVTCL